MNGFDGDLNVSLIFSYSAFQSFNGKPKGFVIDKHSAQADERPCAVIHFKWLSTIGFEIMMETCRKLCILIETIIRNKRC